MKNFILLLIVFAIVFFSYRSCTKGYDAYAVFVQVNDEVIFNAPLNPADIRIIAHGRKLKDEIIAMDEELDQGNGPGQGKLRWYVCSGIDCEEGWEQSFLPGK